jgi:hypothetical protein
MNSCIVNHWKDWVRLRAREPRKMSGQRQAQVLEQRCGVGHRVTPDRQHRCAKRTSGLSMRMVQSLAPHEKRSDPLKTSSSDILHYLSLTSSFRTCASSFFLVLSSEGNSRFRLSSVSTIAAATTTRVYHLLSAGAMYHGAHFVAVP